MTQVANDLLAKKRPLLIELPPLPRDQLTTPNKLARFSNEELCVLMTHIGRVSLRAIEGLFDAHSLT